tara:strand:+ start:1876 stop:2076 length:201 start_codon:yes stop_codon:yes gene_type:complete
MIDTKRRGGEDSFATGGVGFIAAALTMCARFFGVGVAVLRGVDFFFDFGIAFFIVLGVVFFDAFFV